MPKADEKKLVPLITPIEQEIESLRVQLEAKMADVKRSEQLLDELVAKFAMDSLKKELVNMAVHSAWKPSCVADTETVVKVFGVEFSNWAPCIADATIVKESEKVWALHLYFSDERKWEMCVRGELALS